MKDCEQVWLDKIIPTGQVDVIVEQWILWLKGHGLSVTPRVTCIIDELVAYFWPLANYLCQWYRDEKWEIVPLEAFFLPSVVDPQKISTHWGGWIQLWLKVSQASVNMRNALPFKISLGDDGLPRKLEIYEPPVSKTYECGKLKIAVDVVGKFDLYERDISCRAEDRKKVDAIIAAYKGQFNFNITHILEGKRK